jgi:hypothetical protein
MKDQEKLENQECTDQESGDLVEPEVNIIPEYIYTEDDKKPILVKEHWALKVLAGFGFIEFSWFSYLGFISSGKYTFSFLSMVLFLSAVVGFVTLWVYSNLFLQIDEKKVLFCLMKGNFQILWNEVKAVYTDGYSFVFAGLGKCVVVPNKFAKMKGFRDSNFIQYQCHIRKIGIYPINQNEIPKRQINSAI